MSRKGVRFVLFFICALVLVCSAFVTSLPPPPPDIVILPPTYCDPTNGGVEICDSIDNDCDGTTDEDVCVSSPSSSSSSSSSSSRRSSGSGSSGYIAPVIVKNTTNNINNVSGNKTYPSNVSKVNVSDNPSNIPQQVDDDLNTSSEGIPKENLFFGLSPLRILVYGSIMIVLLVSLLIFAFEYVTKRIKSRKNVLNGTVPASQISLNSASGVTEQSNFSSLDSQDERMINFVSEMRKKGYNDDDIMAELKKQNAQENQVSGQNRV